MFNLDTLLFRPACMLRCILPYAFWNCKAHCRMLPCLWLAAFLLFVFPTAGCLIVLGWRPVLRGQLWQQPLKHPADVAVEAGTDDIMGQFNSIPTIEGLSGSCPT